MICCFTHSDVLDYFLARTSNFPKPLLVAWQLLRGFAKALNFAQIASFYTRN